MTTAAVTQQVYLLALHTQQPQVAMVTSKTWLVQVELHHHSPNVTTLIHNSVT